MTISGSTEHRGRGRVAILGAGIMGCSVALLLARRGFDVTLFDKASVPFAGASGWNEGKIHLGYIYAGDPSLASARRMLPGSLAFKGIVEELVGCSLAPATTPQDDIYLLHRDSIVTGPEVAGYFERVTALLREHPEASHYLADVAQARAYPLAPAELHDLANPAEIIAGFRIPERSVATRAVAALFIAALAAEPRIELRMGSTIRGIRSDSLEGPFQVDSSTGLDGPFDTVVSALWEGQPALDESLGIDAGGDISHRYRLACFVRTTRPAAQPSALIGTGPFGDVKNYNGRDFYLSWYPTGLVAEGNAIVPPSVAALDATARQALAQRMMAELGQRLPMVRDIAAHAAQVEVEGGWVFARGHGALDDRTATIHRRDRFGIRAIGRYVTVDTGKYASAPAMARELAATICGD